MKRALLILAALPFAIVGVVVAGLGVVLLTVACMLLPVGTWPFNDGIKES